MANTKRALLTSALAIVACVAMLIGSTFAWFTDTASTGVNKIQAGNLDVKLEYKNTKGADFKEAKADTPVFKDGALWEPGHVEYVVLKVSNAGNLALKYKLGINIASEKESTNVYGDTFKLSDYIHFAVLNGDKTEGDINRDALVGEAGEGAALNEGYTADGQLSKKGDANIVTLVVWMPTTVGNEANHKTDVDAPEIDLGITVVATQDTVESDSFGKDYDAKATYPVLAVGKVKDDNDTVLKDKPVDHTVKLTAPAGSLDNATKKLTLELVDSATPATITVTTTQDSKSVEVKLKDQNGKEVSAKNGSLFTIEVDIGKDRTGVAMYHDGVKMTDDGSALQDKDNHFVYDKATGYVTMKVSHFSPFTAVYTKANWSDGVSADDKYETPVDENGKVVTIASAEELALFAKQVNGGKSYKGYTVKLAADIDLGDNLWTPIGKSGSTFQGVFDGQGKTISNLLIDSRYSSDMGLFGVTTNGEIKNFTLHNAQVTGYLDVGAVAGTPYTSKYSNIKLTGDVRINGYAYVGGMFGKNAYADLTDLTIDVTAGSYVKADSKNYRTYVGGLVGFMGEGNQTVKNVTSNINVTGTTCDVGGITGIAHYGNTFINCHSSGDVTLTAAQDAGDELEVGGIAGVWLNTAGQTVTLTGCSYSGKLSSYNVKTGYVTKFPYDGLVGFKYNRDSNDGTLTIN